MARKIRLKLLQLLNDFVVNDDSILNDGCYVRETVGQDRNLIRRLLLTISNAKLETIKDDLLREYTLAILRRVYQVSPKLKDRIEIVLDDHKEEI